MKLGKDVKRSKVVAVVGKGGAGKTAVSAMMAGAVSRLDPKSRTLLIDADPAGGLAFAMGVEIDKTIGQIREDVIRQARKKTPSIKKQIANSIDYYVLEALIELPRYSLLAMGRGESVGCFCPVNTLLREAIGALADDFGLIIIDGEAGIEQIMRQVMKAVGTLIVVSDQSVRGLNTVSVIKKLVESKSVLSKPKILLAMNRVRDEADALESAQNVGMTPIAYIPEDPQVREWDAASKPLCELPPETKAIEAVTDMVKKLFYEGDNALLRLEK